MKECNVILIDDRSSFFKSSTINNILERALTNHHLQINLITLNPKEEKYVDDKGVINASLITNELDSSKYLKQPIQLIACDYDLGGDVTNGFEIIRILRNDLKCKKKIILYSSNIEDVIERILKGTQEAIVKKIIDLTNSNIASFCKRDSHLGEDMIKYLQEETKFSTDSFFESELYKYGAFKFKSTYDKFENKTLAEIAEVIAKQSDEGELLKKELIEQVIAYMILMENE